MDRMGNRQSQPIALAMAVAVAVAVAAAVADVALTAADVAALYACNERDRLQFQRPENKVATTRGVKPIAIGATMLPCCKTHGSNSCCFCCHISPGPDPMIEILRPATETESDSDWKTDLFA